MELSRVGKEEGLRGFEHVRRFKIVAEEFSVENDLLTPSMKLKRHLAKLRFKAEIDELYSQLESKL
jgi:long-chain acyl-CoA synthetase